MARLTQQNAFGGVDHAGFGLMVHVSFFVLRWCSNLTAAVQYYSNTVDVVFEACWWCDKSGAYV